MKTHLLLNLIPNYGRLYKKSNMMFFFIFFYNFNTKLSIHQSMFGKDLDGNNIQNTFIKFDDFIYALYRILDYLLPLFLLNNCQIIVELTLTKIVNGKDPSTIALSYKTKFKERFEDRFDTADRDILMMKETFNLMDAVLIYPKKISIKFLLNQPYTEILPYLQYSLDKINNITDFVFNFHDHNLHDTIQHGLDFGYLQKDLLNMLLSHYKGDNK
jgi:hypothetical protein